jgi:hypothetical protein
MKYRIDKSLKEIIDGINQVNFIIELIITLILYIYSIPNKIEFNEGPE